jgi:hypothetical protein
VDEGKKGRYIVHNKVAKDIKKISEKKTDGIDDVPGDVLKCLGEDGIKIVAQLMRLESGPVISQKLQ